MGRNNVAVRAVYEALPPWKNRRSPKLLLVSRSSVLFEDGRANGGPLNTDRNGSQRGSADPHFLAHVRPESGSRIRLDRYWTSNRVAALGQKLFARRAVGFAGCPFPMFCLRFVRQAGIKAFIKVSLWDRSRCADSLHRSMGGDPVQYLPDLAAARRALRKQQR